MVNEKMCIGIINDQLMARIDPDEYDSLLNEPGAGPMTFTKKPMKGFLYIQPEAIDDDNDLDKWLKKCLDYNPRAKASKKSPRKKQ